MKLCPKCSTKNENAAGFCKSCGESLADVPVTQEDFSAIAGGLLNKAKDAASAGAKKAQQAAAEGAEKAKAHRQEAAAQRAEAKAMKDGEKFIDPGETSKATLGNNYLQNILLGGGTKRGAAILTEKRLYYFGKCFASNGGGFFSRLFKTQSASEESIVSVEDITQTLFIHTRPTGSIWLALLLLVAGIVGLAVFMPVGVVCLVAALVFFIKWFISKTTIFEIAFPGGKYHFDMRWYPIADMQDFQRQIHLMKDHLKENG